MIKQGTSEKLLKRLSQIKIIVSDVAIIHSICGTFMPVILVIIMTRFFGKNKSWVEGITIVPFAILVNVYF